MRTTTRGIYALKAMLTLAEQASSDNPLALHRIAKQSEISPEFLQQIFFRLRKAGLISAYRGPGGGFFLSKPIQDISVLEILEAAGENLEIAPCSLARQEGLSVCSFAGDCKAGRFWGYLESEIRRKAEEKSLADVMSM